MTASTGSLPDDLAIRVGRYRQFEQWHGPYLLWQLEQFAPVLGQRVLEIGCGIGGIAARLSHQLLYCGVDVEADVLEVARERFANRAAYTFRHLDFATCPPPALAELASHDFDTVLAINVLEHIEDDAGAVQRMADLVFPGGHVLILVPAHPSLYGDYDRLDGHFRRYSRSMLAALAQRAGLTTRRLYHFNAVGALGWWWHYRVRRQQIHGAGQFSLMNRLIPLLRPLESHVPPPFGLSLIAVLQRPASCESQ